MKRGKVVLITLILVLSIFLISCKGQVAGGEQPLETAAALKAVQSGTQGVEVNFVPNYPPPTLYDENELIAILEVKNKGNHDLVPQDCFVQITGFDPNIISGGLQYPRSCGENIGILEGKNIYNIQGGINQIEFRSDNIVLPGGDCEYNPDLNVVTCYNYHTSANPEVCVDPLFYQVTSEQKTCVPQNVGMGGGQGGPVGVSYVGVNMVGSKAIFEINVVNNGAGRVLAPFSDIQGCGEASLQHTDFDKVGYGVEMSGGSLIDCKPFDGLVRLYNGQGKIVCSFNVAGATAFKTPLQINLEYSYIQSMQKQLKIISTPK